MGVVSQTAAPPLNCFPPPQLFPPKSGLADSNQIALPCPALPTPPLVSATEFYNPSLFIAMYCLQHERPCCIGYTNSSRRREFVYPIQHGRECCKRLKKRLILWVHWRSNFKNKRCLSRENQSLSLCKSTWICITYTDTTRLWFFFVFSSWIINEFFKYISSLRLQVKKIFWKQWTKSLRHTRNSVLHLVTWLIIK